MDWRATFKRQFNVLTKALQGEICLQT